MKAVAYTDGSVAGPPRPDVAGAGWVLVYERDGIWDTESEARPLGELRTPQQAEYHAALWALRKAKSLGVSQLLVRTDSKTLVDQMNGDSRVKDADLQRLWKRVHKLRDGFDSVRFEHILRRHNHTANRLAAFARSRNRSTSL